MHVDPCEYVANARSHDHKERLLRTYWSIPERQIETSVVLADRRWAAIEQTASASG
ncbi:MAG TPA: hypothetical protein VFS57_07790 [Gemmatimonadaceae bacterium]|nr:hypothetical protein [Gemmatimonadaceae bacterium]